MALTTADFLNLGGFGGLGQSSMSTQGKLFGEQNLQQQQFQQMVFTSNTGTTSDTITIHPNKIWELQGNDTINLDPVWPERLIGGGFNSISCAECASQLDWQFDYDTYARCSCGWREGDLTNAGWLQMRLEEVTG